MSVFTGPSQSPARVFKVSKEVCASDFGAVVLGAFILCVADCTVDCTTDRRTDLATEPATECAMDGASHCATVWAKATVASDSRTTGSRKRIDFIFDSPVRRLNRRGVVNAKFI